MNAKTLTDYYNKNKEKYDRLASNCSSVSEILLKIEIYGNKWTQWDWALFFYSLSFYIAQYNKYKNLQTVFASQTAEKLLSINYLYDDVIDTIDNNDMLDKILTNKAILLSIIQVAAEYGRHNNNYNYMLYKMLAHIFKKFPKLWQMNWMWSKYFDKTTLKWTKYHRFYSITKYAAGITEHSTDYTKKQKFYDDFQSAFYNLT